jgi:golgi-specific brefeldin A-resistance guanine nucleotide exchange factor 1
MVELLRVLINILDPNDKLHTDSTRLVAMRVLINAFEVAGTRIGLFSSLSALISDHGCKFLFQLARSDNPSVLQLALRTISTVFEIMLPQLKLQQELFFTFTIDRLAAQAPGVPATPRPAIMSPRPPQGASPAASVEKLPRSESPAPSKPSVLPARGETKELLLDILSQLCNYPSFMVDLFTNYDCDINCEDLFNHLINFVTTVSECAPMQTRAENAYSRFTPLQLDQASKCPCRTRSITAWRLCSLQWTTWLAEPEEFVAFCLSISFS